MNTETPREKWARLDQLTRDMEGVITADAKRGKKWALNVQRIRREIEAKQRDLRKLILDLECEIDGYIDDCRDMGDALGGWW